MLPSVMNMLNDPSRQVECDDMVDTQIVDEGIVHSAVISAMRGVPRHRFIPVVEFEDAYGDFPLPIGYDEIISQPYIVDFMSEALDVQPGEEVLEIGTGSGYQAAVFAELGAQVFSIEIVEPLAVQAKEILTTLGYAAVVVRSRVAIRGGQRSTPLMR